ncbi:MAG: nucleotidyltransferase domain-containing protein [Candidatus Omnitrophica bacterium]|nr:nucleotidyltransferase domain-containing protein [Candidatus Omnitrophota bacterium]
MSIVNYAKAIKDLLCGYKNIDYVFLFGSVLGNPLANSDVDILIGGNLDHSARTNLAMELELVLKRKIDVVLQNEASCEIILKAFSKGKAVLINDKEKLKKDYFRNFYLYDDTASLRQLRMLRIKRRHSYGG